MKTNNAEVVTLNKKEITDFALTRNILLRKSKSDWVFFVDSDETISSALRSEVQNAINSTFYSGYYINRKNYFLGNYVGQDKIVRLGKRTAGKWRRSVHETWEISGKLGELKNPLIHNTATSLNAYITKINFYSTLHAKANKSEGKTATLFKIVVYPPLKFLQTLIKSKNVAFSIMQAFHSFLSWAKMYLLP